MIRAIDELPPGSTLQADVCIVGAGPAGISLALELMSSGLKVMLLEAGTASPEFPAAEAVSTARAYDPNSTRQQGLGGTSGIWTGVTKSLQAEDLNGRSRVGLSSWPIGPADLEPWMSRARQLCHVADSDDAPARWAATSGVRRPERLSQELDLHVFPYSPPTRFGSAYGPTLASSRNSDVLLGAKVTRVLVADNADRCDGLLLADAQGVQRRASAKHYVLAGGGIEIPRLLLASRSRSRPRGIGNDADLVGRYFMEHPVAWVVPFVRSASKRDLHWFDLHAGGLARSDGTPTPWRGHAVLPLHVRDRLGVLGSYAAVTLPGFTAYGADPSAREDERPPFADITGRLAGSAKGSDRVMGHLSLVLEQEPNRDSRVMIAAEPDGSGMPQAEVAWRLSSLDEHTLVATLREFALVFGRAAAGHLQVESPDRPYLDTLGVASHHMGTARMGVSPQDGVVDRDCRLFDVKNLWIAGSASFRTSGYANPTLTIVALAVRLAATIARETRP